MLSDFVASALATLLVTLDPASLAPIFIAVTGGMSAAHRRQVAVRACVIALGILTASSLGGGALLRLLGVSLPAFRIAGGLLLFWIAFEMVFERRTDRKQQTAQAAVTLDHIRNVAAFPLAIPLMAGPGAITAVILLSGRSDGNPGRLAILIGLVALVIGACLVVFLSAERVSRLLGITGNVVLSRLLGVVLAAMAVQFTLDGLTAALQG